MGFKRKVITKTLVMANPGAYAAGDQVGAVNVLENAAADTGGTVELESVVIIDKAKQSAAIDLFFFDKAPVVVSVDNGEFEMTDANMADAVKGVIKVAATDYAASKLNSVATLKNVGLFLKSLPSSKDLFVVAVSRGTPTYADEDLVLVFGFQQGANV